MKLRGRRGGTLGIIIACAVTIIIIGVCFFFLAQIFGGQRELAHATDSGILNLAKQAIRLPGTNLRNGVESDAFGDLGEEPNKNRINLLTYNRAFGTALLIALNAQRDGVQAGKDHARQVVAALQSGPDSLGGRLTAEMETAVLKQQFDETAKKNSTRMLNDNNQLSRTADYDTAFMMQRELNPDSGATNITVPPVLESLFTSQSLNSSDVFVTVNGKKYLRGYSVPGLQEVNPIGVPVNPQQQPHLVSATDFNRETDRGGAIAIANVPPNAFKAKAQSLEKKTGQNTNITSFAIVGVPPGTVNIDFPLQIPRGYIEVVNGPLSGGGAAEVPPPFAGLDHWLNNEGLVGTPISGNIMARSEAQLQAWADYLADQQNNPKRGVDKPSTTDLFLITNGNKDARPATEQDIANGLNFNVTTNAQGKKVGTAVIEVVCFDSNVTGNPVNQRCADLFREGVFDEGFHPNGGYKDNNKPRATALMSIECVKCKLQNQFNACGGVAPTGGAANCGETGLRTFNCTSDGPTSPSMGSCRVSTENNAIALARQAGGADFVESMLDAITFRLQMVRAATTKEEVRNILETRNLNLGDKLFLSVNAQGGLTYNSNTPPGFAGEEPDGKQLPPGVRTYKLVAMDNGPGEVCGFVNPHHEGGIHDIMYREFPQSSSLSGTDRAQFTQSSGFKNMFGRLQLTNSASGSATGFCKPD